MRGMCQKAGLILAFPRAKQSTLQLKRKLRILSTIINHVTVLAQRKTKNGDNHHIRQWDNVQYYRAKQKYQHSMVNTAWED